VSGIGVRTWQPVRSVGSQRRPGPPVALEPLVYYRDRATMIRLPWIASVPTRGLPAPAVDIRRRRKTIGISATDSSGLGSMLALSDNQLAAVMTAAGKLPTEKRGVFLERVVARLSLDSRFTPAEFADAVHLALRGLIQEKSAALG
jgi:hypothetical protein